MPSSIFQWFFILFSLFSNSVSSNAQKPKAIFIIVDGIPADVIEKQPTPALDAIAKEGFYSRAYVGGEKGGYSQTPTISAVGYNSLLTGTWVNKHNVWGNDIKAPNYNYPTIFNLLRKARPEAKLAIFSSWQDNRTKLIGDGLPQTGNIRMDHHFDGLELDTVSFPHDRQRTFMHRIDEAVVNATVKSISNEAPDLTWVYLEYTDDMGHMYGDSEQFYKAVALMDEQIRRIWQAVTLRNKMAGEQWAVYITTDHGRDAKTGKGHGGQSDRERETWIVSNIKVPGETLKKYRPGIVDIMPSLADFLGINITREQQMEIDGVSLSKNLSGVSPEASFKNGNIHLSWKAIRKRGKAKIWITTTDNYKQGNPDTYQLVKTVAVRKEAAAIDVSQLPSPFYKVVLEMPHNFLNRWVMIPDKIK